MVPRWPGACFEIWPFLASSRRRSHSPTKSASLTS